MKKNKMLFAVILVSGILLTIPLSGQTEKSDLELPVFGIGLHAEQYKISDALSNYYSAYTSTVLFPLNLTQHFRLEPEIGLLWMNDDEENETSLGISSGLGIFGMFQREKLNFYAGGRIMFDKSKIGGYYNYNGESIPLKYYSIKVGPAFGFEYFLSNNFSLGGEIGTRYSYSKSRLEDPDMDDEESTSNKFNFDSGLFLRVFF